jgi:hypothetical protein
MNLYGSFFVYACLRYCQSEALRNAYTPLQLDYSCSLPGHCVMSRERVSRSLGHRVSNLGQAGTASWQQVCLRTNNVCRTLSVTQCGLQIT